MPGPELVPTRRPVPDDAFGGRLRGAFLLDLEVRHVDVAAAHVRSVQFASTDLLGLSFAAGQDLMLEFPARGSGVRRRYTVRRADPEQGTVDVEFELHPGAGMANAWAAGARAGDRLQAIGPRGTVRLRDGAPAHVFVADDSAMPAAFAMLEALPAGAVATAVLVTPQGPRSRPAPDVAGGVELMWGREEQLEDLLRSVRIVPGAAGYVNGERRLVQGAAEQLRRAGLAAGAVAAKAYWRRDRANAAHGEPGHD